MNAIKFFTCLLVFVHPYLADMVRWGIFWRFLHNLPLVPVGNSNGTLRELLTVIVGSRLQSPLQAPSATYVQGIVTAAIRTA